MRDNTVRLFLLCKKEQTVVQSVCTYHFHYHQPQRRVSVVFCPYRQSILSGVRISAILIFILGYLIDGPKESNLLSVF